MTEEQPTPRFIEGARPRSMTHPLEWPVEYGGKVIREVTVRRLSTSDIADFVKAMEPEPDREMRFPMFDDEGGQPVPEFVLDMLDDDDMTALNAAAVDFLPRRFRAQASLGAGSTPDTGAPTELTSGTPSAGPSPS